MTIERTLSIIKPDAINNNIIGQIISRLEGNGLRIVAARMQRLTKIQAENFYAIHKSRSFFNNLVEFMISGPILVQVLEGENAVFLNRNIIGSTNPKEAHPGTIRADFALSIEKNAVHGSDNLKNAEKEISFFFRSNEIF